MKLLFITWNVAGLPHLVNFSGTGTNKAKPITNILRKYLETPDTLVVINLQELFDEKLINQLEYKLHNYNVYCPPEKAKSFFGISSGLMTITNHPFDFKEFKKYANSHGEDSFANKGFTVTKIKGYLIYNTHTQNENVMIGVKKYGKNALKSQIKQFGESFNNEKNPTIAGGDFNINESEFKKNK